MKPFLFKFMRPCSTHFKGSNTAHYDTNLDMIVVNDIDHTIPIIQSSQRILVTKKADVESGEDQKDSLI